MKLNKKRNSEKMFDHHFLKLFQGNNKNNMLVFEKIINKIIALLQKLSINQRFAIHIDNKFNHFLSFICFYTLGQYYLESNSI